jgi:taurine transport system permease protein
MSAVPSVKQSVDGQSAKENRRDTVIQLRSTLMSGRRVSFMSFLVMFAIWAVATTPLLGAPMVSPVFLPSPQSVVMTFLKLAQEGYQGKSLLYHYGASMFRFSASFIACVVVGVPVGLMMGMFRTVRAALDPPIEFTRPIPKLALLPLFVVWFGIGEFSKIFMISFTLFPIISISAMEAVKSVSLRKIQAAKSLGASDATIFWRILLPGSLPGIFTGLRVSVGLGVAMLVGAEMVATSSGVAFMALAASDFLQTNIVLVGVTILAVTGYLLDLLVRIIEKVVVHWSGRE